MQHLNDVVIVEVLVKLLRNDSEFLEVNDSILILIEEGKDSSDSIFGLCLSDP